MADSNPALPNSMMPYRDAVKADLQFSVFITNPQSENFPQGWHYFATIEEARICAATEGYPEQRVIYRIAGTVTEIVR